jgi:hypothetical protein
MTFDYVDLPDSSAIRNALEKVNREDMQMFLKSVYLTASLPLELAGELTSTDRQYGKFLRPIGPTGNDVTLSEVELPDQFLQDVLSLLAKIKMKETDFEQAEQRLKKKIPVAIFKIKLTKKDVESFKLVALPMSTEYEPWTEQLYKYYKKRGNEFVFPFNRQDVWEHIYRKNRVFAGLSYTVVKYTRTTPDRFSVKLPTHTHRFGMQALRVVRTNELVQKYHFDPLELAMFVGLAFRLTNMPIRLEIPKTSDYWNRYIKKLCIAH